MQLSEILGKPIKRICTGSELLLAWALNKYSKVYLQEEVTLDGLVLLKRLQYSEQFAFLVSQKYPVGAYDEKCLCRFNPKRFCGEGIIKDITLTEENGCYIFNWQASAANRIAFHAMNRASAYVELLAYVIVMNYKNKTAKKLIIEQGNYTEETDEYSNLLILKEYGNRIAENLLELHSNVYHFKESECQAFYAYYKQRGYMLNKISTAVKYDYAKKNLAVGQVFLLYKRYKGEMTCCYPAVIQEITDKGIRFTYYSVVETKLTRRVKLEKVREKHGDLSVYDREDFEAFHSKTMELLWDEVGVDVCAFDENFLLMPLMDADGTKQAFRLSDDTVTVLFLNTIETVYAVFENRGVKYDKQWFLTKYFPNGAKPIYDKIIEKYGYDQMS